MEFPMIELDLSKIKTLDDVIVFLQVVYRNYSKIQISAEVANEFPKINNLVKDK